VQLKKQYVGPDGSIVPVIDVERFDLADGEQMALVGSSGSGKTTLLHLIAGILAPDSGHILFGSSSALDEAGDAPSVSSKSLDYRTPSSASVGSITDLTRLSEAHRDVFRGQNIGYIFQTHHLLPGFTAMENVLLGMTFGGSAHDPAWAKKLLNEVGLSERLNYKPNKLSVGQQQRVAIARALANRPKLVLADEPTGSLDAGNAQQALDLIRKLCTEVGASLLLVSHDPLITKQMPRALILSELNRAAVGRNAER
jgi:putative ABC transport system ATP-binding protein